MIKEVSMFCSRPRSPRQIALAATALGTAAVLLVTLPSRGQQNLPTIHHSHPPTRSRGATTDVTIDFTLPPSFQLRWHPRIRVVDAKDQTVELLLTYIDQRSPVWRGHRGVHSESYRPGTYRVRSEIDYRDPSGKAGTVASPWTTLTVPER